MIIHVQIAALNCASTNKNFIKCIERAGIIVFFDYKLGTD